MSARSRNRARAALCALVLLGAGACRRRPRTADAGGLVASGARADGGTDGAVGAGLFHRRVLDPHNVFGEVVPPAPADAHPFLVLLRNHLRKRLLPADAAALDALDLSGTAAGSERAMQYKLADACARTLVPVLFGRAAGDERAARPYAARLAQARPVVDAASAEAVAVLLRTARGELLAARERLAAESGRAEGDGGVIRPDESLADEFVRVAGAAEDLLAVLARADAAAATVGECVAGDAGAAEGADDAAYEGEDAAAGTGVGVGEGDDPRPFKPEGAGEGDSLADVACLSPTDAAIVLASAVASEVEELSDARASDAVLRALRAVVDAGRHPIAVATDAGSAATAR